MATLYDLGDQVDLQVYIYNDAGALASATVTCTITLPDGTTTSPSTATSSTGVYTASYKPTQAGTHYVRWVATSVGAVSGEDTSYEDAFTVSESTNSYISLAEAREYLTMSGTEDDDELLAYIQYACDLAQQVADTQFARATVTDTISCRGDESFVSLSRRPVISVTSVTERGTTLTAGTQYSTSLRWGRVYRMSSTYERSTWAAGTRSTVVVYIAGYAIIPPPVRFATLVILDHLWKTQRGTALSGRPSDDDVFANPASNWFIPNRARDILMDYRPPTVG